MKKLVIGNLKMNLLSQSERDLYLKNIDRVTAGKKFANLEIVLCPSPIHLEAFKKWKNKKISRGALNVFWEDKGSFTGEVSPIMLKNFGCEYVVVGHSERRRYLREEDQDENLKILAALKNDLKPILCVGENADQKTKGANIIVQQLQNCLEGVAKGKVENIVFCYEPVWAISSNNPDHLPNANDIMSARLVIMKFLVAKYGVKVAGRARIIYGGSVAPDNVEDICIKSGMDGALVGKESLTPSSFIKIVEAFNSSK